ncbi:MAG: DUF2332 domain-containing protein [Microlunatus sp.]|nr:DUF2332 domain-containing protein [Microlunatus sp.]
MVGFDLGDTLADRFRAHAAGQSHLYGHAERGLADDFEAGGPTRAVFSGYEDAPTGSVVQLRLLAAIFRLVLTGRAPALEPYYACLGGEAPPSEVWPPMRAVIAEHTEELHAALTVAPQTNEIGRTAALLVGLFDAVAAFGAHRIRLLELGASAGLHQLLPWFHVTGPGWGWGPTDSPVQLLDAVRGEISAVGLEVVTARGCDLDPVDATTSEGRLRLTSFVWPFDLNRHERLAGALTIADRHPPIVDRAPASDWLIDQFGDTPAAAPSDPLTVVWHSVTQLYWPPTELAAVAATLSAYGREHRLAEIGMEYAPGGARNQRPEIRSTLWSGDCSPPRRRLLGTAHDHGVPVRFGG